MIISDQSANKPIKKKETKNEIPHNLCHMIRTYENELDELTTKCESIDVVLKSLKSFFFVQPKTTKEQLDEVHNELTIAHDDMLIEVRQLYRGVIKLDKCIQSLFKLHPTIIPPSHHSINKNKISKKNTINNKKKNNQNNQNIHRNTKITNDQPKINKNQQIIEQPSIPITSSSYISFPTNTTTSYTLLPMNYNMNF